eukprot:CAMPEP_0119132062 /NCGR_PEP_ID=MMETSP1310-20130426/11302_1 /TAXON_ID=464262 /ORGANISM="Genus nov. species nov., Strain RCC2339" /LENGTH=596 /DNA_ID=CAMNT_0007122673 /DNA_START=71 /DNA_END=1861 /DNA_ORIENTATION=+
MADQERFTDDIITDPDEDYGDSEDETHPKSQRSEARDRTPPPISEDDYDFDEGSSSGRGTESESSERPTGHVTKSQSTLEAPSDRGNVRMGSRPNRLGDMGHSDPGVGSGKSGADSSVASSAPGTGSGTARKAAPYADQDRSSSFLGGILSIIRKPETPEERRRRESKYFEKEEKKRTKARVETVRKGRILRPVDKDDDGSRSAEVKVPQGEKGPAVVHADCIADLPEDVVASMERMKIDKEEIEKNFDIFLNIMSFTDKRTPKRRFTSTNKERIREENRGKFYGGPKIVRMLKTPEELFEEIPFLRARKFYKWDTYLGYGGFGQVVEAKSRDKRDVHYSGRVAIKFQNNATKKHKQLNIDETSVLKFCDHPNIVKLYRVLEVRTEVWMIMELIKGGTLKQASTKKGIPFAEGEIAYVGREMLRGIDYLHTNELCHRDLKNMNVMLTLDGGVKLIDFGLAVDLSTGPRVQMVGSPFWMPPEMISGQPHSFPVDIWSFTACLLELANQRPPGGSNVKRTMFLVATKGIVKPFNEPNKWGSEFKDIVKIGTSTNPENRSTAKELLSHPFLSKAATEKEIKKKMAAVFVTDALSERGLV